MNAKMILDNITKDVFDGKKIEPVLPEFYNGAGGDWTCWIDDIQLTRQDGYRQNYIINTRGVLVVYCKTQNEAMSNVEKILQAFTVNEIINTGEFIAVDLERIQIVNIRNIVAVVATVKIIEEQ